ncbi:cadherin-like domain-containing protein [Tistrella bauzanensis]
MFWTEGNAPVNILPIITVADDDGDLITSARVWISNPHDGDVLAITAPGPYTASVAMESGALVLTLTGSGTAAQMQAALRTITYSSTADAPAWGNTGSAYTPDAAGSRILRATVTDADGATSDVLIGSGIAVTSVDDDAPALTGSGTVFTPGSGGVRISSSFVVIDDSVNMSSATITLVNRPDGAAESLVISAADKLAADPGGDITVVEYNPSTGVLTLTGTASMMVYINLVRAIHYDNSSAVGDVDGADRTVRFVVTDEHSQASTAYDMTVEIDTPPSQSINIGATVAEGGTVTITAGMLTFADDTSDATQIIYTLSTITDINGTLYRNGVAIAQNGTFTQADINNGLITYTHNGGELYGSFTVVVGQSSPSLTDGVEYTFNVTTTPVNDAPVISLPGGATVSGTEDTVFNITTSHVTFTDTDASSADVVVTITSTEGTIAGGASGGGVTVASVTNGVTLTGSVLEINTFLASAGNLTFTPVANASGNKVVSIAISDQGNTGTGGTLTDSDTLTINLAAVNDAPVISGDGIDLPDGTEHSGTGTIAIADLLSDAGYSDADSGALSGIAITGVTGNSIWQYTTDGTNWFQISSVSESSAVLLDASASLRYVPDFENGETATISFRAWDQTTGTATSGSTQFRANITTSGGGSAFSANVATATIDLTDLNDSPSISSDDVPLTGTDEDTTSDVVTVSDLLTEAGYGDADNGASAGGIALTASAGNGTWQYSTDSGANWYSVGSVSWGAALLLKPDAQLRYVPDGDNGESASLTFKGWDQTQGTAADGATRSTYNITSAGGLTAFSSLQADATITVTSVNDAPVATVPGSITVTEDVATALAGISFADVDAGSGTVVVTLSVASGVLAATTGSGVTVGGTASALTLTGSITDINAFIAANGVSFTTAANATADVTLTVGIDDGGNTGGGGAQTDSDTVTLSVTAGNDAPVISGDDINLPDGTEHSGTGTIAIADLLSDAGYSDADSGALSGIAITGVTGNSIWQYTTDGTNWFQISSVSESSAVLLDASASLRYVPDFENGETATISFRAWDQTTGTATSGSTQFRANITTSGGGSAFSANVATATIDLTDLNDSPSISSDDVPLTGTDEDTTSDVVTVSDLLTEAGYGDADNGASAGGIALTASAGNGTWQYSTDSGANWYSVGSVSWGAALLLKPDAQLRYVPDGDNGESASLTFKGWDQTQGTAADGATRSTYNITSAGGLTAFSSLQADATITVTSVNDAPVATVPGSITVTEDVATALAGISFADVDAGSGTVVVTLSVASGALAATSGSGVTVGGTASALTLTGSITDINAFIAANGVSFTTAANATADVTLTVGIDDGGNTGGGGAQTDSDTVTLSVTAGNDAPVISGDDINLPDGTEHSGTGTIAIADLLSDAGYSDADSGALSGIAITGVTGNSIWQYTTDGTNWFQISSVSESSAVLLDASASLRYVPDFENGETATISFRAWDQTTGTATSGSTQFRANITTSGGGSAFSANVATATIDLTDLNDSPSISSDDVPLTGTDEDTTSDVVTVSDLLTEAGYGDADNGASAGGIALTGSAGNGTWQYSTDSGANWYSVGSVSWGAALLLKPDAQLRYVPDGDNGESASLTFKGWDQTQGTAADGATRSTYNITSAGGLTAFSSLQADATITVTSVNDAPVATVPGSITVTEDVATALAGISFADVDAGSGTVVVTLSVASGALAATTGSGVTVGGTASALTLTGTVANINAFIAASGVSFTTAADATADVTLTVAIGDGGNTGSGGAQTDSDTVTLSVTAVNDAPVISGDDIDLPDGTEHSGTGTIAIADLLADAGYSDADSGALSGIAITGVTGDSVWQYTTNGTDWFEITSVSDSSAILLDASASLRYVPDFENGETASITFRAWDQTTGTATNGASQFRANITTSGGSSAFSTNAATTTIVLTDLNDSPSISPDDVPLTGTDEDTTSGAVTVSDLLTDAGYDDPDIGASAGGIALTGSAGNGTWQYSTDSGTNWFDVGAVSWGAALLLKPDAQLRYIPDGDNGETASLTFKGWDQTDGTAADGATRSTYNITTAGGMTAFSFQEADATITVTSVNDAPTIAPDDVTLTGTDRETTSDPVTISDLLTDAGYGDVDTGALSGIAITALTGNGTWEYTTDGTNWFSVGAVSDGAALLLSAAAQLRYTPDGVNPETATIGFKAWDQTSGTATSGVSRSTADTSTDGGTTAFSSNAATAELAVVANNEAPVLTAPATLTVAEDTDTPLTDISIADADDAGQDYLLIITADSGSFSATGTADVDVVAEGHTIRLTGSMADLNDFIAAGNVTYRTAPNATQAVTLDVSVSDQDAAIPETDTASVAVTVTPVNDAPDVYTVDDGVTLAPAQEALFNPLLVLDAPGGGYYVVSIRTTGPDADNNVLIYRYDADGALDESYGTGGVAYFAGIVLDAVTVQADGQLLVAAHSTDGDLGLFRVATDGTVDTSFGPAVMTEASYDLTGADIEIDSAGKIFVTAQATPTAGLRETFIYRFSADGVFEAKLDVSADIAGNEVGLDSVIQSDGKIVTVARRGDDLIVFRQNADGTLDTTFATVGYTVIDSTVEVGYDALLGLQADGSILLAVPTQGGDPLSPTPMIWRFTGDGELDTSFGTAGSITGPAMDTLSFAFAPDGGILVTGTINDDGVLSAALLRYTADGLPDGTFGRGGEIRIGGIGYNVTGTSLQVDAATGDILLGGAYLGETLGADSALFFARFDAAGQALEAAAPAEFTEGGAPVVIAPTIAVDDIDLGDADTLDGYMVALMRDTGPDSQDQFSAADGGTLDALITGQALAVSGTTIGSVVVNAGGTLLLTLNANATRALVNEALRQISYANSSDTPPASVDLVWTVNDNNDGTQGSGGAAVGTLTSTVAIVAVNDTPVITVPGGGTISVVEDTETPITGITFSDADAGSAMVEVEFVVDYGVLSATSGAGVTVTATDQQTIVLSGSIADINTFIANGEVTYQTDPDDTLDVSLTVTINDLGNSGPAPESASEVITITVDPVNDAPDIDTLPDGVVVDDNPGGIDSNPIIVPIPTGGYYQIGADQDGASTVVIIARYTAAGELDTSYGTNGIATLSEDATDVMPIDAVVQADGSLVIASTSDDGTTSGSIVRRFDANGTSDPSFAQGGPGLIVTDVTLDDSGRILLTGSQVDSGTGETDGIIARLTSAGEIDPTFTLVQYDAGDEVFTGVTVQGMAASSWSGWSMTM